MLHLLRRRLSPGIADAVGKALLLDRRHLQSPFAVAAAAFLCNKYSSTPRSLYENHLSELKGLVAELTACDHEHPSK
ncbi:hypothetical protein NVV93_02745 [Pseudomonas sp. LS44]|nr:hypothetical protein NVV93_02745 [Pseudomonas sp. LS44]